MSFQKLKLISFIVLLLCLGCKSKPETQVVQKTNIEMAKEIGLPDVIPEDWPLTREEIEALEFSPVGLYTKALESIGLHTRSEIVAYAYKLLEMDLSPLERYRHAGFFQGVAYQLLGLYGSLEDAEKHFHDVKSIVHQGEYLAEPLNDMLKNMQMIRSLGFYLMRDHFMPQENRSLMVEIEEYLLSCTIIDTPSCWPFSDLENGNDELRRYALNALSYSCSEKAKERMKTYLSLPEQRLLHIEGKYDQKELEETEKRGDEIRAKLKPVLPAKEIGD